MICLLFHIVAFDIETLVIPWHEFVYTLFIPCGRLVIQPASFRSSSFTKRLPARCSFIFGNRKKSDGVRSGLYGGCSKMSQWNCSHNKALACRAVCGRAFPCNRTIPREGFLNIFRLQKTNYTSHLTVSGILNRHSHGNSYLCIYHVTRSDINCMRQLFNITLNTRNQ